MEAKAEIINTEVVKAKTTNRIFAYIVDISLVILVVSMINSIKFINPNYDKYVASVDNYNEITQEYAEGNIENADLYDLIKDDYYDMNKYAICPYIVIVLVLILYFGVFQKFNNGQTLGKKIMKVKTVDKNNNNPTLWQYLIRTMFIYFIKMSSVIPIILNILLLFVCKGLPYLYITMIINMAFIVMNIVSLVFIFKRKDGKGIHDLIAGTMVVNE